MPKNEQSPEEPIPTFTLSVPAVVAGCEDLAKLDSKISESVGTMGQIMATAKASVRAQSIPEDHELLGSLLAIANHDDGDPTWESLMLQLDLIRSNVEQAFEKAVTEHAGDTILSHRKSVEALQTMRESRYKALKAMYDVLSSIGPAAFPGIDKVTLPSPTGSTRGRPAGVKNGEGKTSRPKIEVYRVGDDGKRHFLAKGSPLNLVAFRWFGQCGIEALQAACEAAGIDISQPWEPTEVTVTHEGTEYTHKIGGQLPGNPDQ